MNHRWLSHLDEGQFAALRAVAIFVSKGEGTRKVEREWFTELLNDQNMDHSKRQVLAADLANPPPLAPIYEQIKLRYDRRRLLKWAATVITLDQRVCPAEKEAYAELLQLDEIARKADGSLATVSDDLVEHVDRIYMWQKLGELGKTLNTRVPFYLRRKFYFYTLPALSAVSGVVIYGTILTATYAWVGYQRYRMNLMKPLIAAKLEQMCARVGHCGDAVKHSDACVEINWNNSSLSSRFDRSSRRLSGLQTDTYIRCLNYRVTPPGVIPAGPWPDFQFR